jgi:hypothetical protein
VAAVVLGAAGAVGGGGQVALLALDLPLEVSHQKLLNSVKAMEVVNLQN